MSLSVIPRPGPWRRVALLLVVTLLALRAAAAVTSHAGLHWDFTNYYNTGCRAHYGEWKNLYHYKAPIHGMPAVLGGEFDYVGFPLTAPVFIPLCALPLQASLLLFKAFCLACFVVAFWILYRHFRGLSQSDPGFELDLVPFLAAVLLFEPAWRVFPVGGQSTPLAFLLFVIFWVSYAKQRLWVAAAALCVAFLFKPFLAVMVLVFVAGRQFKLLGRLMVWLAVAGGLSLVLFGWEVHLQWLYAALQKSAGRVLPWWYNASLGAIFSNFWVYLRPSGSALTFPLYLKIFLHGLRIVLAIMMLWLAWRGYESEWPEAKKQYWYASCAAACALFFHFVIWAHYLVFLFPLWMYWAMQFKRLGTTAKVLVIGCFLSTFRANQIFAREISQRFLTIDTVPEVLLVGLYGSATLSLTLFLLIHLRPRTNSASASVSAPSEVPSA